MRKCVASKPALQEIIKEVFQVESNSYSMVIQIHTYKKRVPAESRDSSTVVTDDCTNGLMMNPK